MTYQDDPNLNRRTTSPTNEGRTYNSWIIGGVLALVAIICVFALTGRDKTTTATNTNRPAITAPATTGSAVPTPGSGNGTAGAPSQNTPAVPVR